MVTESSPHPDWAPLEESWELSLRAEGYAQNSVETYLYGPRAFRDWATEHRDGAGPADLNRNDAREWLVWMREHRSSSTARKRFDGARSFYRWALDEDEVDENPFDGIQGPVPNDPVTNVLKPDQVKALRETCAGRDFRDRRDLAIIDLFFDTGIRLAELAGLDLEDVSPRDRMAFVEGKGSRRRGPKPRAVPFGVRTAKTLDAYMRARRRQPYAEATPAFLLAPSGRRLSISGIKTLLRKRGEEAGIQGLHPHMLRHTWASAGRRAGLSDGDMMYLGGWSTRAMLDRYGAAEAAERAQEAYRGRSVLDQL